VLLGVSGSSGTHLSHTFSFLLISIASVISVGCLHVAFKQDRSTSSQILRFFTLRIYLSVSFENKHCVHSIAIAVERTSSSILNFTQFFLKVREKLLDGI